MINKNNNKNKVRTDKRFSVCLSIFFATLAVLTMASGSTATTIVYASHDSTFSSNTGSPSSTPSTSIHLAESSRWRIE